MPPPSATPRVTKSVHYEPIPPPPPHFPLPPPFNERMIAFGLPLVSVPVDYLGPRKVTWNEAKPTVDLATRLQIGRADSAGGVESYDLRGARLCGGGMREVCLALKPPVRRAAVRHLDLSHSQVDEDGARVLGRFLAQAPSAVAPLKLSTLSLSDNGLWPPALASLARAFADNEYAAVEELTCNNTHVGTLPARVAKANEAAETTNEDGTETPVSPTSPSAASVAASDAELVALRSTYASRHFSPLIGLVSSAHVGLRVLDLSQVCGTDLLIAYLAEGVRGSGTLQRLSLAHNDVSDVGATLLASALGGLLAEEEAEAAAAVLAAEEALAALHAAAEEDARTTARASSRQGMRAAPRAPGTSAKQSATTTRRGKEDEEESAAATASAAGPLLSGIQPLPVFGTTAVNTSLRTLDLRGNPIGLAGARALESMARRHAALRRCDLDAADTSSTRRVVSSLDARRFEETRAAIGVACARNARVALGEMRLAFALGLHARVGAHSPLRTLVREAQALASASSASPVTPFERATSASRLSSANVTARTIVHSRTGSRVPMPSLSISQPTSTNGENTSATANDDVRSATPSPIAQQSTPAHALLLHQALADIWEFIGCDEE